MSNPLLEVILFNIAHRIVQYLVSNFSEVNLNILNYLSPMTLDKQSFEQISQQ